MSLQSTERSSEPSAAGFYEDVEFSSSDSSSSDNTARSSSSAQPPEYSPLSSELSSDTECTEDQQMSKVVVSLNREGNENLPTAQGNHKRILTE